MKIISFKYILLLVFLYIYLYNPPFQFLGFGAIKILLFISIFYLIISEKGKVFFTLFRKEMILTLILIFYSLFTVYHEGGSASKMPYLHIMWFIESFLVPFCIMFMFKDILQKQSWESIIVNTGLIAALITFFLILNPGINSIVRNSIIQDSLTDNSNSNFLYRGFSIADSPVYGYGIVQGLILSICLISIQKNYLYAIPVFFLFVSILFNARIGFSAIIVAGLIIIISRKIKFKNILIYGVISYLGYLFLFQSDFAKNNLDSLQWGFRFFDDTSNFINGQDSDSNYSILFKDMLFFPSNSLGLIFGEGRSVAGIIGKSSDIGYVNQIFIGGVCYLLLMLSFLVFMFKTNLKSTTNRYYPFLFFLTLIIVNIKGFAFFVPSSFFRLYTFYYIYCILLSRTNNFIPLPIESTQARNKKRFLKLSIPQKRKT